MFKNYRIDFFLVVLVVFFFVLWFGVGGLFDSLFTLFNGYFLFDSVSFYLVVLVILLGLYSQLFFSWFIPDGVFSFLFLSLFFSILCFCVNHSVLFWCFYELSMLPLLYLIFKDSPYSERFLAGWYFACYLLVTSLPLILLLVYLSALKGSFLFSDWRLFSWSLLVLLSFVLFTKVPLVPFHTWLPIVHAEATSIVSMFLSGYIMKLGLLGVYRCCSCVFDYNLGCYLLICFLVGISFLIAASGELDGKRWLAFLSLSHIIIPFFAFFLSGWGFINYSFFYCFGHGLSAGLVFALLWYFYDLCNSRKWLLLKSSISGNVIYVLVIFSLLSLCSFPTTVQFFCEVRLIEVSLGFVRYILFWFLYLFFGGLIPLVLCGHLLIRRECVELYSCDDFRFFNCVILLLIWCYGSVLFI